VSILLVVRGRDLVSKGGDGFRDAAGVGEVSPVKLVDFESLQAQIGVYDLDARLLESGSLACEGIADAPWRA
jgi:hypothetical protein